MSTVSPIRPSSAPPARPASAGGAAPASMPQLDIGRMLRKYWLTLCATVFFGIGLGVATHFAWLTIYPFYVSTVLFECQPPKETTGITVTQVDNDQLERFKGDQAAHMKSDRVLLKAASTPRIVTDAPRWAAMFTTRGTYVPQEGLIWLRSHVRTRMSPTTSYIELALTWKDKEEVAELVGYVRDEYEHSLDDQVRVSTADERDALARGDLQADVVEDRVRRVVAKRDLLEADTAFHSVRKRRRALGLTDGRLDRKQREDLVQRGRALLQHIDKHR